MIEEEFKFIKPGEIRVRIAPSPTGALHIGTARTALFNYLFSRQNQGTFVLRIEDTDIERSNSKWEKDIMENLKWLGIEWSEGPDIGEDHKPYKQSKRTAIYAKYLEKLLEEEKAYYCFCSEEDLEEQRQYKMSIGQPPIYSGKCAGLSKKEVKKYLREGKPSIIRFRVPLKKVRFEDLIRGNLEFDASLLGDISIAKDLSTPLYNFAVVVDDFEMKISHVIRGEDHLSNTPKQILIQKALGFPKPKYCHLPLILDPDRTKLSKRHGATTVAEYRKAGYLPETLVNFMAFLGWNPGIERDIYSMASLIKEFSLERVQKGGAVFNAKRLNFLNGFYIRQKSIEKLTEICLPYLIEKELIVPVFKTGQYPPAYGGMEITQAYKIPETKEEVSLALIKKIVGIYQERLKKLSEISEFVDFFFKKKLEYDKDLLKWREMTDKEVINSLDKLEETLYKIKTADWKKDGLEKVLMLEIEKISSSDKRAGDRGYFLWPLRVALTGKKASAGPFEIAEILGKEKTLKRIQEARELLK
ncbi:glutamate--tRNA ligase [Patescibacteria group bacterium]